MLPEAFRGGTVHGLYHRGHAGARAVPHRTAMPTPPVAVQGPSTAPLPIVIDSPHSGTDYPADFGARIAPPALRQGEDTWVDGLYERAPAYGATLIAARFPRSYIDPNRSLLDIDEALLEGPWPGPIAPSRKTELGIGLVWRLMAGEPIYDRRLPVAEVQARIERCWRPYHAALEAALAAVAAGPRWHLNVHSMPDDSYRRLGLPDTGLADIVLGNLDDTTSHHATLELLAAPLRAHGYSVAFNDPFKGVEIIRSSGNPARGHEAVQVEVKRSLYMDREYTRNTGYPRLQAALEAMLHALADHARVVTAR
jgi:N-formylglutamate deformylase